MTASADHPRPSRPALLGLAAVLGLALSWPTHAQVFPAGRSHGPALGGAEMAVTGYGGAVDLDYPRKIVASANTVTVFDVSGATGWVQEAELGSLLGIAPTAVHDVAIEGNLAAITYDQGWAYFLFIGGQWQLATSSQGDGPMRVEILDHVLYLAGTNTNEGIAYIIAYTLDQNGLATGLNGTLPLDDETVVELEVGRYSDAAGTFPDHTVLLSTRNVDGVTRTVHHFDGSLALVGTVATGTEADGFGDALATDGQWIWIGAPSTDAEANDGGRIWLWRDFGTGTHFAWAAFTGTTAGGRWGRSLDTVGTLLVFGESVADLVPNGAGVGAVRALRLDSFDNWALSGETIHSWDGDYSTPDDFGAAVALDSVLLPGFTDEVFALSVGEPAWGGSGSVGLGFVSPTSHLEHDKAPGLAGVSGVPNARIRGWTEAGQPLQLSVDGAATGAPAFLFLGANQLSAPFLGGVFYPTPDELYVFLTDPSGAITLPTTWPSLPGPVVAHLQFWIEDAAAPFGYSSTEGITIRQDHQ